MNKLLRVTAVAGALLLAVNAYADQHSTTPKQTINVGSEQHTVRIALPANATTGYQWYVSDYNTDLLTLAAYHYLAPTSHRVGAGGTAEFIFTVKPSFHVAPQITDIDFVYGQSWDMNGATSRVIALTSIPAYSSDSSTSSSHEGRAKSGASSHSAKKPQTATGSSNTPASALNSGSVPASTPAPAAPQPASTPASSSPSSTDTSWLSIPAQS
ncbi:MAG: hypothetical protein K0Q57_536 [Gammaproteobacteria bacterium]|jgi:predicted secreted protein|nr:hypothetical protein [Gammaproteobacteria bacterium]